MLLGGPGRGVGVRPEGRESTKVAYSPTVAGAPSSGDPRRPYSAPERPSEPSPERLEGMYLCSSSCPFWMRVVSDPHSLPESSCVVAKQSHRGGHRGRWPGIRGAQRWGHGVWLGTQDVGRTRGKLAQAVPGQTVPDKTPYSSVGLPSLSSVCLRILKSWETLLGSPTI